MITQYTKRPPSSTGLAGMDGRASVVILWCLGMTAVMTRLGPVDNVHHICLTKAQLCLAQEALLKIAPRFSSVVMSLNL
jgi:hypothetical protein